MSETDSYSSDSDSDSKPAPSYRGRKNIKAIKTFNELSALTKSASFRESARKLRVSAHLRELEKFFPDGRYKDEVILDFDKATRQPTVSVHPNLRAFLKPHQKEGIRFMWSACCESVQRVEAGMGSGCILAHCMGLGKTLQVIAFCHTLILSKNVHINKILVLCPKNTMLNWVNEFDKWLQPPLTRLRIYCFSKTGGSRDAEILQWAAQGGVYIASYNAFRLLIESQPRSGKRPVYEALINPGPDLVICDEGHILKNNDTKLSKTVNEIKTMRRVILTGTPMQNNLNEYFCMVSFVQPHLLGTKAEFFNMFVNPIHNGECKDSEPEDVDLMKKRSHVLHRTLLPCVQRYDYSTLAEFLPQKLEFVLSVRLTEDQTNLYKFYLNSFDDKLPWTKRAMSLFADYQLLQRVWTHPYSLMLYDQRAAAAAAGTDYVVKKKRKKNEDGESDASGGEEEFVRPKKWKDGWWRPWIPEEAVHSVEASVKLLVLFDIIQECERKGDKLLVFSGSLFSLEMIEYFLTKKWSRGAAAWVPGEDYFILSGATSAAERDEMCQRFNDPANTETRLFLISTKAGGMGITLNAANRAVMFDASWNPSHDIQSIFRIYRLGQQKPCFVYRLVASGTMEEKIYLRQVTKQSVSHRVVDEMQIARHYTSTELKELYELEDRVYDNDPAVAAKDPVLKRLIDKFGNLIGGYHEHDSLLEHKTEEELNFADKMFAWSDFNSRDADLESDNAIVTMMSPELFHIENFKIVIRQHYKDLPESAINSLVTQLLPRALDLMQRLDFKDLLLEEALEAKQREITKNAAPGTSTSKVSLARNGRSYLSSMPKPVKVWGSLAGKDFGSPGVLDSD